MNALAITFAGRRLKNPLVAAAGPITTNPDQVERLAEAGIAAVITKPG